MKEVERSGNEMFIILADIPFILCGREKIEPVEEITKKAEHLPHGSSRVQQGWVMENICFRFSRDSLRVNSHCCWEQYS